MNRDFAEILSALSDAGAEFVIVGAHALAAHGVPRATGDLDIWVRPSPENARRVLAALRAFGAPLHDLEEKDLVHLGTVFQIGIVPCRVDILAPSVLGPLLERHPKLVPEAVGWTASRDMWLRRASAVAFNPLVQRGLHLDTAYDVATRLFDGQEDLLHQAVGWMLREAGKKGMAASSASSQTKKPACRAPPCVAPSSGSRRRRGRPSLKPPGRNLRAWERAFNCSSRRRARRRILALSPSEGCGGGDRPARPGRVDGCCPWAEVMGRRASLPAGIDRPPTRLARPRLRDAPPATMGVDRRGALV